MPVLTIQQKLFTGAQAFAPLANLLGSAPFRWYDTQLRQGSAFPAVVVTQISNPKNYAFQSRVTTSWYRMQFDLWAQPDSAATGQLAMALFAFLDQFNAIGIAGLSQYPNLVVGDRGGIEPNLEPPVYRRTIDVRMFNNDTI